MDLLTHTYILTHMDDTHNDTVRTRTILYTHTEKYICTCGVGALLSLYMCKRETCPTQVRPRGVYVDHHTIEDDKHIHNIGVHYGEFTTTHRWGSNSIQK